MSARRTAPVVRTYPAPPSSSTAFRIVFRTAFAGLHYVKRIIVTILIFVFFFFCRRSLFRQSPLGRSVSSAAKIRAPTSIFVESNDTPRSSIRSASERPETRQSFFVVVKVFFKINTKHGCYLIGYSILE